MTFTFINDPAPCACVRHLWNGNITGARYHGEQEPLWHKCIWVSSSVSVIQKPGSPIERNVSLYPDDPVGHSVTPLPY